MAKKLKYVPLNARQSHFSLGGTAILILWQRSFAWPSWIYAVIWTLWGIVLLAQIYGLWLASDDKAFISDEKWRKVFGDD